MANTVETLVGQMRTALETVVVGSDANPQDVYLALKQLTREFVMPEKTHATPPSEPPPGGGNGGNGGAVTITGVTPSSGVVGQAVTLTVTGTGFTQSSQVKADGNGLVTTYVSATELQADAPGALAAGTIQLSVDGSAPIPFEVVEASGRRSRER